MTNIVQGFGEEETEGVDLTFPIEFYIVDEVPVSLKASGRSKERWKATVEANARAEIGPGKWATERPVSVTIFYFPDGQMRGDIDNIVKPILDAMMPYIYLNDSQVERVLAQRFEPLRAQSITNPSPTLAAALDADPPVVYIRVDYSNELVETDAES